MTENELKQYWGKNIRIICTDGETLIGFAAYFADSYENEPDEASITIENEQTLQRDVVVSLSEIQSIEIIS